MNPKNLRENPVLTQISLGYTTEGYNYIAEKLFPSLFVPKRSGKIVTYDAENLRVENTLVAHNSPSPEVTFQVSISDHFDIEEYRLKSFITKREIEEADKPIDPKKDATMVVTDKLKTGFEALVAQAVTNTTVITQTHALAGTAKWSDYANSDPIADIRKAVRTVKAGSGMKANTVALSWEAMDHICMNENVRDQFPGASILTHDLIQKSASALFGVKNILVGDAPYNSAQEGEADVIAPIWGTSVFVGYIETNPTQKSRSFSKCYRPTKNPSRKMKEWTTEDPEGTYVRAEEEFDLKIIDPKCGYVITDVYA